MFNIIICFLWFKLLALWINSVYYKDTDNLDYNSLYYNDKDNLDYNALYYNDKDNLDYNSLYNNDKDNLNYNSWHDRYNNIILYLCKYIYLIITLTW